MSKITLTVDEKKAAIRDQATAMVSTLQTIQSYESPTNAQVVGAVKKLAEHQEKIIKFIGRNL